MINSNKIAWVLAVALPLFWSIPALAHSFNAALLFEGGAVEARTEILNGFRLATAERDGHADEVSDGHLGGLDVYVLTGAGVERADVIVRFGDGSAGVGLAHSGAFSTSVAPDGDAPGVAAFVASYGDAYGESPGARAAEGYHAARRIDAAVRAQGGVGDADAFYENLAATTKGFAW